MDIRIVFPCGHEIRRIDVPYTYGVKHNGARPSELHLTGELPEWDGGFLNWQSKILHPYKCLMTLNGEVVYQNGEWV